MPGSCWKKNGQTDLLFHSAKLGYQRSGAAVKYQRGQQEVQEKLTEESRNIDFVEVFFKKSFLAPSLDETTVAETFLNGRNIKT